MKVIITLLVISVIGNFIGLVFAYKYLKTSRKMNRVTQSLVTTRGEINRQFERQLLFIHHSVGQNWLKEGALKDSLENLGIGVHSATYGSDIGQNTDMCDWVSKFDNHYDKMLKYDMAPDILYPGDMENSIIMFKPCFPNSDVVSEGTSPGNPSAKEQTVWNYKAVFENISDLFAGSPQELFIYVTAPPLVRGETTLENAARAREFNNWVKNEFVDEYRKRSGKDNFYVFDLFDVLADSGNCLSQEYMRSETNSHPNAAGSREATARFLEFLRENGIIEK